jgi:ribonuclease PH
MFNIVRKSIEWGHDTLTLETGKIARQADACVIATYGETSVLAAVVYEKKPKPGLDFFPLTVHYQEKYYAAGKVPGGFFKREARPTEKETLTSRLIDRPIRPLFVEGFKNETQVICTVLSYDMENDPDVVAMVAASAALTLSGAPFFGPIGAARVGFVDGAYVLNPAVDDMEKLRENPEQRLDLIVAGTKDAVMMVESEAYELSEAEMLGAVKFGHEQMQPVIDAIIEMAEEAAKEPFAFDAPDYSDLYAKVRGAGEADMREAFRITDKQARQGAIAAAREKIVEALSEEERESEHLKTCLKKLESEVVRGDILESGKRIDGRDLVTVRPIESEVGLLPRTHGSSLFTRGETQALVVTTLGTGEDEQFVDALHGTSRSNFLLHYNFPGYSVGETQRMMGPGRREIGHGKLAWRALQAVLPAATDFPLHDPRRLGDHRVERLLLDGNSLRRVAVDDGCGRAPEVAGRWRRHGPHPRGRAFRGAHRHPRRRGPPGRHGLQGCRHRQGHHLPPDGHQGGGHHPRDHVPGPRAGEGRPDAHPRRDEPGAHRRPPGILGPRPAHRDHAGRPGQDPRGDRLGRQGDPRHRRGIGRQGRHQRRRHHQDREPERRGDREGPRDDRRDRRRARGRSRLFRAASSRSWISAPS